MRNIKIILISVLILIIFISGCTTIKSTTEVACGNTVVESGEECDGSGCSSGEICSNECTCEVLSPPSLPE